MLRDAISQKSVFLKMRVPPSLIVNRILPCVRFLRSSDAAQEYLEQGVNVPEKQRLAKQEVCNLCSQNNKNVCRCGYTPSSCEYSCIELWTWFEQCSILSFVKAEDKGAFFRDFLLSTALFFCIIDYSLLGCFLRHRGNWMSENSSCNSVRSLDISF